MAKSSISTMWAVGRFQRAADFVARIRDIGFDQVELNHQVSEAMVAEFRALQATGEVSVSSVHAPCPRWNNGPLPELSALDENVRRTAIDTVKRAIDLAVALGGRAVVVHSGGVEIDQKLWQNVQRLYSEGLLHTPEYERARNELVAARASARGPHLHAVIRSLEEVSSYAAATGIRIGLENRYHYHEIPLPDEIHAILAEVDGSTAFYWHDLGHAQSLALLDLVNPDDWLPSLHGVTLGLHLHDAIGRLDHRTPGMGQIDFAAVVPFLPPDALRVCEFDHTMSEEQVKAGYERLKELGFF